MGGSYIRLNNEFIVTVGSKYYTTDVKDYNEWKQMSHKEKKSCAKKNITKTIRKLLDAHGVDASSKTHFKTTLSKKKIRTRGGWLKGLPSQKGGSQKKSSQQTGGWGFKAVSN